MRNKLVITLTTVYGSRQYTLSQIAKYLLIIFILLSGISFFISNALLVVKTDNLATLEEDHQTLSESYDLLVGSQQLYLDELKSLAYSLDSLKAERDELEQENLRMDELNDTLDSSFYDLESLLGVEHANDISSEHAKTLTVEANKRLFFLHSIPNGVPIQAIRISERFGFRMHPIKKKRLMHNGIDFKADKGTPVYATADAVVEFAGYQRSSGFGNLVILQHNFGFKTYFAHMKTVKVRNGDFVSKGQLIGLSGNSGRSTGPHLHYEVRHLFKAIDPEPFLSWDITNFNDLFTKVKGIKWASLEKMYPLNLSNQQSQ